ncbi:MAG TPA: elongation factor EF-2 [Candidatus Thermoplasmatota archaeon]|nr:elongation factor EF-2 [Candidatus Thermoplasmatota archaeon]
MGRKEDNIAKAVQVMGNLENIRNIAIAAHIDHGKTTFSDNLLAGAGMISQELAGQQRALDFDPEEQARGITINAACASMVHHFNNKDYLVNLIDTPGHVDFGGDVTRAMRAVDGCIILVCAVEGPMPQTETVVRQALREKVRPTLFINKVDRLINELKVTPEEMQARFVKIINKVNELINRNLPEEFRGKWGVRIEDGSVMFGSAYHKWGVSLPYMKKSGVSFKQVYDHCKNDTQKELAKIAPVASVVLDTVADRIPSPKVAQEYRIRHIWHGDQDSVAGKSMREADPKGVVAFMVTKIMIDPHAGEIAIGRLFSGTVERGVELYVGGTKTKNRIQQVGLMVGADRIPVDKATGGNIVAITGLRDAMAGYTMTSDGDMEPFERIVHVSDPVVTVAVECKHMKDLPKLVDVLRQISKGDPSVQVKINQETGENLMSGMGELHLEVITHRIERDFNLQIVTSNPIVVYRESVKAKSPQEFEGKSPNRHNRFFITAEPLADNIIQALRDNDIPSDPKKHQKEVHEKLTALGTFPKDLTKKVKAIDGTCMLVDGTKAIQNLHETFELIIEAFNEAVKSGPRAGEPIQGVMFIITDAKLHEDAVHRGPAQTIPAVRNAIYGSMTVAGTVLIEPMQKAVVTVPDNVMGGATGEFQKRRGLIQDMQQEGDSTTITAKVPVAEMLGFAGAIRSATGGRCLWSTENIGFEVLAPELQEKVTRQIRERKGLKPEPYPASYYAE